MNVACIEGRVGERLMWHTVPLLKPILNNTDVEDGSRDRKLSYNFIPKSVS